MVYEETAITLSDDLMLKTEDAGDLNAIDLLLDEQLTGSTFLRRRTRIIRQYPISRTNIMPFSTGAAPSSATTRRVEYNYNPSGTQLTGYRSLQFPSGTQVSAQILSGSDYSVLISNITAGSYDLSAGSLAQDIRVKIIDSGGSLSGSVYVNFNPIQANSKTTGSWTEYSDL